MRGRLPTPFQVLLATVCCQRSFLKWFRAIYSHSIICFNMIYYCITHHSSQTGVCCSPPSEFQTCQARRPMVIVQPISCQVRSFGRSMPTLRKKKQSRDLALAHSLKGLATPRLCGLRRGKQNKHRTVSSYSYVWIRPRPIASGWRESQKSLRLISSWVIATTVANKSRKARS